MIVKEVYYFHLYYFSNNKQFTSDLLNSGIVPQVSKLEDWKYFAEVYKDQS